jgi:hypothetical protein
VTEFRFGNGDRVRVELDRQVPQDPEDERRDGSQATIMGVITKAQIDGYRAQFDDGYVTFIYEHEAVDPAAPEDRPPRQRLQLCHACGSITPYDFWTLWRGNPETGVIEPAPVGWSDPIERCPVCSWDHIDDDSGPGVLDGDFETLARERAMVAPDFGESWVEAANGHEIVRVYVCACGYSRAHGGRCRSHPYPARAMGPEMVPHEIVIGSTG